MELYLILKILFVIGILISLYAILRNLDIIKIILVYFKDKFLNTPIYSRDRMPFEFEMKGPAIIEQMDTTILIEPNDKVYGDYLGNMFIEVGDFS